MGEDKTLVKRTLVGFGASPNVFAVLVVGNGCEQLQPEEIAKAIAPSGKRVEVLTVQEMRGTKKTTAGGGKSRSAGYAGR
jgi:altronate dehydratase large subunit